MNARKRFPKPQPSLIGDTRQRSATLAEDAIFLSLGTVPCVTFPLLNACTILVIRGRQQNSVIENNRIENQGEWLAESTMSPQMR